MVQRVCLVHDCPLLDLQCAYRHGSRFDRSIKRRVPNYEVDAWAVVCNGVVIATCTEWDVQWKFNPGFDAPAKLVGRESDGSGGRPWSLDGSETYILPRKIDTV